MNFLYPGYFLALLGLIPLIAVYLLKVRPRRHAVTALFLWQAVFDQKKNTALFDRLRDLWSLLMMILAFVAVVLAMTSPEGTRDQRQDLLLILDNSASMQALDGGPTRLDRAKSVASDIVRGLNGHQRAGVATVSMDVQYASHFTTSPKTLMEAIHRIEPSDCPLRPEALDTLAAGAGALDRCRMILISDGGPVQADVNHPIELIKIGSDQENVGFIACDLRLLESNPIRVGLYYQLASCFDKEIHTDVMITYGPDNRLLKVIPVTIKPGINEPEVYTITGGGPGPWKASLDLKDALAKDNVAFLALQPKPPIKVKVESQQDFFLVNCIQAFAKTSGDLQYAQDQADVVLADGQVPQAQRAILFGLPEGPGWCGQVGKEVDRVIARVKLQGHPVLRDCDLDAVPFIGARQITLPEDSLVLVETSEQVPLIYTVRDGQRTAVVINLDAAESEFYYSAWFPVLVHHGVTFLMGRQDSLDSSYKTGESVTIPVTVSGQEGLAVTEGDDREPAPLSGSVYGPLRHVGIHRLENPTDQWWLGVNLSTSTETLLNHPQVTESQQPISRGWPWSMALTLVALGLMLIECMLYHRRKVG